MNNDHQELSDLIQTCLEGQASDEQVMRLNAKLRSDAAARDLYLQMADTHSCLAVDESLWVDDIADVRAFDTPNRQLSSFKWLQWRPLAAAAAGGVVGSFCTSVLFAYASPALGKDTKLLQESFESGPAPMVSGAPMEAGHWSGDYTEVVGEQQGVKPESGKNMLRFLRGDYEGKPGTQGSRIADIYRLIDLRPYRQQIADGSWVVQLSAGFATFVFPSGDIYEGRLTIHAFDEETLPKVSLSVARERDDNCLANAGAGPMRLYRNQAKWKHLTSDLRVPADTDFLLVHIMISAGLGTNPETRFGGHYIDDVRLTLTRRLPSQ